jgi:hypothetical protein
MILTTQKIVLYFALGDLYMKGRLLQSLTITKIKLKPLPENPRI